MQPDHRIILGGQPVNVLGAMSAGMEGGQRQVDLGRQNALHALVQARGPEIMAGNQNAMNALSQMGMAGLEAAQGVQMNRQNMDLAQRADARADRQQARLDEQFELNLRQEARLVGAEETARQVAQLEQTLTPLAVLYGQGDRQAFAQYVAENGLDPQEFNFDTFQSTAAQYGDVYDVLVDEIERNAPPDASGRFKVVGSQLIDLQAEGGPQAVLTAPGQEEVVFDAEGNPIVSRGPVGTAAKLTEGQSKDIGFATRARDAINTMNAGDVGELASVAQGVAENVPLGVGRQFQTENYQVMANAGTQFLLAVLRKDTGAAVTPSEEKMYGDVFLPRPGDKAPVLAQKARAREIAIASLESGMNSDQILAQGQATMRADESNPRGEILPGSASEAPTIDFSTMPAEEVLQFDINNASVADIDAWNKRMDEMGY